jgi:hypothetical protein
MTDEQILECTKVVYNFLCDYSDPKTYVGFGNEPLHQKMTETLTEYGFNMVNFCQFVNTHYNFYEEPLWVDTAQEFFSDDFSQPGPSRAKLMLKSIIRNSKIEDILCQNM